VSAYRVAEAGSDAIGCKVSIFDENICEFERYTRTAAICDEAGRVHVRVTEVRFSLSSLTCILLTVELDDGVFCEKNDTVVKHNTRILSNLFISI
jgi:hypothetical protein